MDQFRGIRAPDDGLIGPEVSPLSSLPVFASMVLATRAIRASFASGLAMYASMPAARQRLRSSSRAPAVTPMTGVNRVGPFKFRIATVAS